MFDGILEEYKKNDISKLILFWKFIFSFVNFWFFCLAAMNNQYVYFIMLIMLELLFVIIQKLKIIRNNGINIYDFKIIFNIDSEYKKLENKANLHNLKCILEKNNISKLQLNNMIEFYKTRIVSKNSFDYVNFFFVIVGFFVGADAKDEIEFKKLLTSFFTITFAFSVYFILIISIINSCKNFFRNEYYEDSILKKMYELSMTDIDLNS